MSDNLSFFAGETARSLIKKNGLQPDMVRVIAGAAGGPKFLVLSEIDRFLFSDWLNKQENPIDLVGSSIGAWRFAALSMKRPLEAYDRLYSAYIKQRYEQRPTRDEISIESAKIMEAFLGDSGISEILDNRSIRLNILSVKSRWPTASENRLFLGMGLFGAALSNLLSRNLLKGFFKRSLFHHPKHLPPFLEKSKFPIDRIPLSEANFRSALLSSGSIPFVMRGISNISGAPNGIYRDGGLIDYHMDIPYNIGNREIVLMPHYIDKVTPGWLDKKLWWREPNRENMKNVLVVSPSKQFVRSLPYGKIPDRKDFYKFEGRDDDRIEYWQRVAEQSKILAEELDDLLNRNLIGSLVKPFPQ